MFTQPGTVRQSNCPVPAYGWHAVGANQGGFRIMDVGGGPLRGTSCSCFQPRMGCPVLIVWGKPPEEQGPRLRIRISWVCFLKTATPPWVAMNTKVIFKTMPAA